MPTTPNLNVVPRLLAALVALTAVLAVVAPAASAHGPRLPRNVVESLSFVPAHPFWAQHDRSTQIPCVRWYSRYTRRNVTPICHEMGVRVHQSLRAERRIHGAFVKLVQREYTRYVLAELKCHTGRPDLNPAHCRQRLPQHLRRFWDRVVPAQLRHNRAMNRQFDIQRRLARQACKSVRKLERRSVSCLGASDSWFYPTNPSAGARAASVPVQREAPSPQPNHVAAGGPSAGSSIL